MVQRQLPPVATAMDGLPLTRQLTGGALLAISGVTALCSAAAAVQP
jgi:hypothetical protein